MAECSKYSGLMIPLLDWPNPVRLILYLIGLGWTFLGIGIISDVFMEGIEKVTSWKKRVRNSKTGKTVTVYVWNATVANLTLMALGSSAPEILLSLIEIFSAEMFLGDLGAGTIVGSAAFNLLCISAVCVMAIPDGEVRYIKQTTVYMITSSCSVFAYIWLMFILQFISPNVCTLWEAILTLLFCPMLVAAAYVADIGYFDGKGAQEKEPLQAIPENVTEEELAQIEKQIRDGCPDQELTSEQITEIMNAKYFSTRSRAYYRHAAMTNVKTPPKTAAPTAEEVAAPTVAAIDGTSVMKVTDTGDCMDEERQLRGVVIGFESARYAFLENCGNATLVVVRSGSTHLKASVAYKTRNGSAVSGEGRDYMETAGIVEFGKDETKKHIVIPVIDDDDYEENMEFYVDLSDPKLQEEAKCDAKVSSTSTACVVIIDDDHPGVFRFKDEEFAVSEGAETVKAEIEVERVGGASGTISCKYNTENMKAIASMDYEETSGTIEMGPSVQKATIYVPILSTGRFKQSATFILRLTDASGCGFDKTSDGGEKSCVCHVTINGNDGEGRAKAIGVLSRNISSQQARLGHRRWRQQFHDALFKVVEDPEEEDGEENTAPSPPTVLDYCIHGAALPWKLFFAFVPPVDYCGGWACFFGALLMIAVVTAIVGDMANLVGCCMTIQPEITAITFVALGTSLPDTFASKAAAQMDEYADASLGNITGSNSVNVFLGLGLSWSIAAFYWELSEPTPEWIARVEVPGGVYYDIRDDINKMRSGTKAVFVAPAGSLWFNLMVFSVNAICAIQHLFARRKKFGGELGGPRWGCMGQYFSASFLLLQWVLYITASSIFATLNSKE